MRRSDTDTRVTTRASRFALTLLIIATLVVGFNVRQSSVQRARDALAPSILIPPVTSEDHVRGNPEAPIHLFIYSDFECPYCKHFYNSTLPEIELLYGSKIFVIYRHFPLPRYPKSFGEAVASECVSKLGGKDKFWRFVDEVFTVTPSENGLADAEISRIAEELGVGGSTFESCRKSAESEKYVADQRQAGAVAGVSQTPSIIIREGNVTQLMEGDRPQNIKTAIEYFLARRSFR